MLRCLLTGALRAYKFQCSVIAVIIQAYVFLVTSIAKEVLHLLQMDIALGSLCLIQVMA
jgi:hypothetical protein